ncbi:MAG TPA: DNA gyrase subunit A [Firmicutes bacterium]|uniref:DNA gyrase subunit A n=1 Tax=Capillibacterium thermochitinicola TaxID=2699427 RepID=A0A8J6I1Y3_9FIRM|nr:DNA gyrase subunit A [Capillibacterium thermochitinicola]MBA2133209.1 DNA gyrase subunit A [Capillibacterium thermochitinicola]HHW12215.1 DNA gyrase subunit A [Bacillota bacterium]
MAEVRDGKIVPIKIEQEMKRSYLSYAMSVIVGRALPDVRDGLKPVHRRILYGMYESGTTPDKPYKKSARIVGDVMGRYHPHGDAAIYDSIVRMAQDFSYRIPLVDGHGNFGSVDGDPPAAMRYTEIRLSPLAVEMLTDIEKKTVDFVPNFDGSLEEPVVLPSRFPNLLVNGAAGIAVGMATNIPPHNLGEVIDGAVMLIDDPEADTEALMKVVKGPDFPTGGIILGRDGIREAYLTGRGSIKVRAKTGIETLSNGKSQIVVTELPYQVNKARLIERIAELVRNKEIEGITDLRDESDRSGMRIVIELKRDTNPNVLLNQLYKHTQLQDTFGVIMLVLVDNEPRVLGLRDLLRYYLEHQKEIITRRTRFDLEKAEARAHIVEGLRIALDHIDAVIQVIRSSRTVEIARERLMANFGLSERQAQAILDMRLQSLTGLQREKLEEEYAELQKTIAYYRELLADPAKIMGVVKEELLAIKEKYADPRRTEIAASEEDISIEDLIADEDIVVTITHSGYIKRLPVSTYKSQRRGGKGITAINTKEEDFVEHLFITSTHDHVLFFTNQGRVYQLRGFDIPEASRQARGIAVVNLIPLNPGEKINTYIPVQDFREDLFLLMCTRNGVVKKTALSQYANNRRSGLIGITLDEGDELIGVRRTDGEREIVIFTRHGQALCFSETEIRPMGRIARGVKGINLRPGDQVVGMDVIRENAELLVITEHGYGKRTPFGQYRIQARGGIGIKTLNRTAKTGDVIGGGVVYPEHELMLINASGLVIRVNVSDISSMGRNTQGVKLMQLEGDDRIVAVARVVSRQEEGEDGE